MGEFGVVLLASTSAALRSEKVLERAGLEIRLIPKPRELSSDCGIAVRFWWADRDVVAAVLAEAQIETEAIHQLGG